MINTIDHKYINDYFLLLILSIVILIINRRKETKKSIAIKLLATLLFIIFLNYLNEYSNLIAKILFFLMLLVCTFMLLNRINHFKLN